MNTKYSRPPSVSLSYGASMSELDEQLPILPGTGTDLMAELGRELTSPLFRQLPPGLITSTRNLRKSGMSASSYDAELLSAPREPGSNGSTPSSHSSSLKSSRSVPNDQPSNNVSLSSSSGKRSMSRTFYRTDLEPVFDLPQSDEPQLFRDDFAANISAGLTQSTARFSEQRHILGTSGAPPLVADIGVSDPGTLSEGINQAGRSDNHTDHGSHIDHSYHVDHEGGAMHVSTGTSSGKRGYSIIPQETRERLIHLVCIEGMNVQSAVKQLNLKYSAAINIVRKFRDCGQLEIGPRGRRSKKTVSPEMSSTIASIIDENPNIDLPELRQILKSRGIVLPPSLIKDTAMNIRRQQMDAETYHGDEETYDAHT